MRPFRWNHNIRQRCIIMVYVRFLDTAGHNISEELLFAKYHVTDTRDHDVVQTYFERKSHSR